MLTLDEDNVLELLKQIVESKGRDYVYNPAANGGDGTNDRSCYYVPIPKALAHGVFMSSHIEQRYVERPEHPKNQTGCVIGELLTRNGFDEQTNPGAYNTIASSGSTVDVLLLSLRVGGHLEYTENARKVLRVAQIRQDRGGSWGEAFDAATEQLRLRTPISNV